MPRQPRPRTLRRTHRDLLATTALAVGLGLMASDGARAQSYAAPTGGSSGNATATGNNATALGPNASASGDDSTAVGENATSGGARSYAGGYKANAGGNDSTAVGESATSGGAQSYAGGYKANASGDNSVAIGANSAAQSSSGPQGIINYRDNNNIGIPAAGQNGSSNINTGSNSNAFTPANETSNAGSVTTGTAIGSLSTVGSAGGVAIGYNNSAGTSPGYASFAIGSSNLADGSYATALGYGNRAAGRSTLSLGTANRALGDIAIAFGRQSYAVGDYAIAQGYIASAYGQDSMALGRLSIAGEAGSNGSGSGSSAGNIAIGSNGVASGGNALALGTGAQAKNAKSVAVGAGSMALRGTLSGNEAFSGNALSANNTEFSVGSSGNERQITNVMGGIQDTDAVNVRQLRGLGNTLATTLGGSFDASSNAYTAPSYSYGGVNYSTVPALTGALDTFALRYDRDGSGNRLSSIDLTRGGAIGGGSGVSITGLAPATMDSGAVALSQMPLRYSTASSPTTANPAVPSNDATLVGASAGPVALHNVGPGAVTASSTDAVNGSQLYALESGATGLVQQTNNTAPITVGRSTGGSLVDLTGTQGTRRLTGLSDGTGASDAATLGQLRGSSGALGGGAGYDATTGAFTAPTYTVGGATYRDVGSALNATNALAVQYVPDASGNPTSTVDLAKGGSTAVALRGVRAGTIAAGSTDAVNGDQLNTTNQNVAALQNGTAGLVQQANGTAPITVGSGTAGTRVNFTNNAGNARVLTGVAAGSVAQGSTDAVNGGQFYDLSQQVGSNYQAIANGTVGLVQQDPTSRAITVGAATDGRLVDLTGTQGPRRLTGLTSGTGDSDAATVGQLRAGGQMLAAGLGGGAVFDPATNTYTGPSYTIGGRSYGDVGSALAATNALSVQYVPDGNGQPTDVVDLARGGTTLVTLRGVKAGAVAANSTDAVNGGQLYAVTQNVADLQNGTTGLVRQDPATRAITVGGATDGIGVSFANQAGTARTLSGIAAGQIAAGSTQGVNGGQIYASNASVAAALGGGATTAADGTVTAPRYVVQGSTFNSVGGALGSLDAAVTNISTTGTKYLAVRSTGAAAQAQGADSIAFGPAAIASADGGVALGANAVAGRAGMAGAKEAFSAISVASTQGAVSVGDVGAERQITNVAGGTADTDAVNLRQLRAAGGNLAGALGGGAGFTDDGSFTAPSYTIAGKQYASVGAALGAVDAYGVKYDVDPATGGRGQSLTLAGGDPNQPVLIRNVAAGVKPTDAANVGQVAQAKAEAIAYTDAAVAPLQSQMSAFGGQLADLNRQVGQVRGEARRGAAIGLAAAALRFDDRPGKISVAAGGGVWRGETAASFGVGYTLPDGSGRVNATGVAAGGNFGVGAGASFTLN